MSGMICAGLPLWLPPPSCLPQNWKTRWFTLIAGHDGPDYRPPVLCYYRSERMGTALGSINIDACTRAEAVDYGKVHGGCSLCFEVRHVVPPAVRPPTRSLLHASCGPSCGPL